MTVMVFSLVVTMASFSWWVYIVFFPRRWKNFIAWENSLTLRAGLPPSIAKWLARHETGTTLKVIVLALTVLSALCVIEAAHRLK